MESFGEISESSKIQPNESAFPTETLLLEQKPRNLEPLMEMRQQKERPVMLTSIQDLQRVLMSGTTFSVGGHTYQVNFPLPDGKAQTDRKS